MAANPYEPPRPLPKPPVEDGYLPSASPGSILVDLALVPAVLTTAVWIVPLIFRWVRYWAVGY